MLIITRHSSKISLAFCVKAVNNEPYFGMEVGHTITTLCGVFYVTDIAKRNVEVICKNNIVF